MVDSNAPTHNRDSRTIAWVLSFIFAVAAIIGWYLYYAQQGKTQSVTRDSRMQVNELESAVQQLTEEQATLQADLTREREKRRQTQDLLVAERDSLTELRQTLAAEQETAEQLQSALEQARQERQSLERNLQQEVSRLASESSELEKELQQRLAQQKSLNDQVSSANAEKQQLSSRLARAQDRRQQLLDQIAAVGDDVRTKEEALSNAKQDNQLLNQRLGQAKEEQEQLKTRIDRLSEQQKEEAAHFEDLRQRLEQELDESRVVITQLKNRMTVINLTSEVLFNSGSAQIKPAGRKVLDLIASSLNAYPDRAISIEGHTDSVPIGKNSTYISNWELSAARSLAAVDYLQRFSQVTPERLRVVGHGEFHPVASNDTAEGRQHNRRIEIRLLPDPEHDG